MGRSVAETPQGKAMAKPAPVGVSRSVGPCEKLVCSKAMGSRGKPLDDLDGYSDIVSNEDKEGR